tara:strand:- start:1326 stop:1655 length:330 start_codon:yes stop_codon:yes gene_type:complete
MGTKKIRVDKTRRKRRKRTMGQYDERVEKQRIKLAAEDWAKGVKSLHAHSLSSMWYDNRPQDTENGKTVMDKEYNNGLVERTLSNGETFLFTKYELRGDDLISAYSQNS